MYGQSSGIGKATNAGDWDNTKTDFPQYAYASYYQLNLLVCDLTDSVEAKSVVVIIPVTRDNDDNDSDNA